MATDTVPQPTDTALDRDPPAWATSLARHRDGLRSLVLELLDRDRGAWPLSALHHVFAAIPTGERKTLLDALCWADQNDGLCAFDSALDALVFAYETHVAAAYQHGPHLGRWQDATREPSVEERADELADLLGLAPDTETRISAALAVPIELVDEPHSDQREDGCEGPHLSRHSGDCLCLCRRCTSDEDGCICPDCPARDHRHTPRDPADDDYLAALHAIPVTVVQIGGAS